MTNASKRRILVVDDEPVIRLFLQELFEDEGYEVATAECIAEGLRVLEGGGFNLVVTDKNLPDGTGFEIVHAAKAASPPCEAMIVTGYASLDSAVMALQIGAYDYILKPIEDVDLLLEKARKAIEKQDLWRELAELRAQVAARGPATAPEPAASPAAADRLEDEIAGGLPQLMKLAELGGLMPMLAHEMRQPLAGIKGYVDLMLHKKDLPEPLRDKLTAVQEQAVHLAGLLDSITSYSRAEKCTTQAVDVPRAVSLALSIFPVLKAGGRYDFRSVVPDDLPPVRGRAGALQQVVVNLLKNAKDAVDEKGSGHITLTVDHDEATGEVRVRVEDTGPGIPEDMRDRLFTPFFTTKKEGVGTGLGLTICKQIVAEHGGRIEVESPCGPDGGAAFTAFFPAVAEAVPVGAGTRS